MTYLRCIKENAQASEDWSENKERQKMLIPVGQKTECLTMGIKFIERQTTTSDSVYDSQVREELLDSSRDKSCELFVGSAYGSEE